jgi:hypothetical protein
LPRGDEHPTFTLRKIILILRPNKYADFSVCFVILGHYTSGRIRAMLQKLTAFFQEAYLGDSNNATTDKETGDKP